MSQSLTIEPSSQVTGGFQQETPNIPGIIEGANISGTLLNKLGTSIPTPFARLHLFNSAFKEMNAASTAFHAPAGKNYQRLVSLALDMFEFLYLYGASSALSIIKWDVDLQTKALKNSIHRGHKDLGNALKAAWDDAGYKGQAIYLFKYENDIIGGTSPLSLFYTNPNLTRKFKGLTDSHLLFNTDQPCLLADRSREFRMYLYKLYTCYSQGFANTEIGQYITDHLNIDKIEDPDLNTEITNFGRLNQQQMENEMETGKSSNQPYTTLMVNDQPLYLSSRIKLWVKDLSNLSFRSDYKIVPSVNTYEKFIENGAERQLRRPLVLNKHGLNEADYVDNTHWTSRELPDSDVQMPLHQRKLPGTEIIYPYLRAEDFFEDRIIELSYNIHKDKFFTGQTEDTMFLLPIKREFLKYFVPKDLNHMYSLSQHINPEGVVDEVTVMLRVPVENGDYLPLEKTYSLEHGTIVKAKSSSNTFNMAFFPFYRDKAEAAVNEYDVMLVSSIDSARLNFYTLAAPDEAYQPLVKTSTGWQGEILKDVRTVKGGNNSVQSTHYHINKPFDIVEVTLDLPTGRVSGLILPEMTEIDTSTTENEFVYGVDFGTTNTQIAFACNNGAIESFHIRLNAKNDKQNEELQTIYLNNHKVKDDKHLIEAGFGMFTELLNMARREFVTSEMDKDLFPIRTAVCEVSSLDSVQHPRLFGSVNIGFNYTHEMTTGTGANRYMTDLKWDTSNHHAKNRIRIFFEELLLLMRNKSVLNKGKRDIKVAVTYPQAMNGRVENDFKKAWTDAAKNIGLDPDNIKFHFESIAPYYSFSRKQGFPDTYVNMDIGGGSTDILYLNPKTNEKMTFSVMFAGNDIWGDGCNKLLEGGRNGFIKQYEASKRYTNLPQDLKNDYQTVKENSSRGSSEGITQRSSDIINYLFKNDENYNFTESIKDSKMILIPIVHFTALIYYLAHIAESQDVSMPKDLSFTGMGSLYLKMLGNSTQLGRLATAIISYKTEKASPGINIIFAPNPKKVTAEGAVTISLAHQRNIELIKTDTGLCLGIAEEEPDTRLNVGNIKEGQVGGESLMKLVAEHYMDIYNMMLKDETYRDVLSDMGYDNALNSLPDKDKFESIINESFNTCMQNFKRDHASDSDNNKVKESLFFWPLKNGLYMLGEHLTSDLKPNVNNG